MNAVGRPADHGPRTSTIIRVEADLLARIDRAAEDRVVSRNWLICRLLDEGLNRLIPVDELSLLRPERTKAKKSGAHGGTGECGDPDCTCKGGWL